MDLSQLDPRLFPDPDHPIHQLPPAQHQPEPEPQQQQQQQQQQLQQQEEEPSQPSIYPDPEFCSRWKQSPPTPEPAPPQFPPQAPARARARAMPLPSIPVGPLAGAAADLTVEERLIQLEVDRAVERDLLRATIVHSLRLEEEVARLRAGAAVRQRREEEEGGDEMEVDDEEEYEEEEEEEEDGAPAPHHSPALLALLPHHCPRQGCNFIFMHAGLLEKHLGTTHDAPQGRLKRFVCPVCRASYAVENQMLQHRQEHSPGHWKWRHKLPVPGGIDCPIPGCAANLTTRQQLGDHLPRAHSGWQRLYPNLKQQRPELFSR
ncbi:hypothetical protein GE09DRAFT_1217202 [Coniochaeta sp. 2T2.1]|nr:hypothetical protein GE09DRAFT_1217202 [Coniochaeta sp. 2T2.1]